MFHEGWDQVCFYHIPSYVMQEGRERKGREGKGRRCQVLTTRYGQEMFFDMVFLRTLALVMLGLAERRGKGSLITFSSLLHPIQLLASSHLHLYWLKIICGDICENNGIDFHSPGIGRVGAKKVQNWLRPYPTCALAVLGSGRRNRLWSSRV